MVTKGTALTTTEIAAGFARIASHMETVAEELNAIDGQLGDGDLGVTLVRGSRDVMAALPDLPDDIGLALMKVAQALTKSSGSSYGTLLATGLMSGAKACHGQARIEWSEISSLLSDAIEAMKARGGAKLGDKTVLDALDAAQTGMRGLNDPAELLVAANEAVTEALERFRECRAQVGRARIFADKSVGLDDPGMVAFKRMLEGLAT